MHGDGQDGAFRPSARTWRLVALFHAFHRSGIRDHQLFGNHLFIAATALAAHHAQSGLVDPLGIHARQREALVPGGGGRQEGLSGRGDCGARWRARMR
ncbi:hypothetical protein D9M70_543870 [compost metagenome]